MDVHGSEMDSVKVPISDLASQKPRSVAMQEPVIDPQRAKDISAGFNNSTAYKGEPDGKK